MEPENNIDDSLEWSKEIDDKTDYLVFYFDDKEKFKKACEKFNVNRVNVQLSPNKENTSFVMQGPGRIISGDLLD